jgi:L-ascorbate metabolism protein UlaG (beta-lactamase superfamily)
MIRMPSACAVVCLAMTLAGTRSASTRAQGPVLELRYVANAGVLITIDGRKVLIDAPIREGIQPYQTSSPEERTRLEGARAPYDGIAAILITHWHEDHFNSEAVAAHLSRSPTTRLISSAEVVQRVREAAPRVPAAQLVGVTPDPGASIATALDDRVRVHVLRIRHNDTRRMPDQHVGFLVQGTRTILHVGDADPAAANFAVLKRLPEIDVALMPFWYVREGRNRAFVGSSIAPRQIVGMHVPPEEAAGVARDLRAADANVILLTRPGAAVAGLREE